MLDTVYIRVFGNSTIAEKANVIIITEVIKDVVGDTATITPQLDYWIEHGTDIVVEFKKGGFIKRLLMYYKLKRRLNLHYYKPYTQILFWV